MNGMECKEEKNKCNKKERIESEDQREEDE